MRLPVPPFRTTLIFSSLMLLTQTGFATPAIAPQYADSQCLIGQVAAGAGSSKDWTHAVITLTNHCNYAINLQDSRITFHDASALHSSWWMEGSALSYPTSVKMLNAQPDTNNASGYLISLPLSFTQATWANSKLMPNQSIAFRYEFGLADFTPNSVKVITGQPVAQGSIALDNTTAQPSGVASTTKIDILQDNRLITTANLAWQDHTLISGLAAGNYTIQPESISDGQGSSYAGVATPASVSVSPNQTVSTRIQYAAVSVPGSINIQAPNLPTALNGYSGNPNIILTNTASGSSQAAILVWNQAKTIGGLINNASYQLSSPAIQWHGSVCAANFSPATLVSNASTPPLAQLRYQCSAVATDKVNVVVNGLPDAINSLKLNFTPADGAQPLSVSMVIAHGSGNITVSLTDGGLYQLSTDAVSGYQPSFSQQPLSVKADATETVTFSKASADSQRMIAYVPGWVDNKVSPIATTPPAASELAAAGYTNVVIAFGVFDTATPGAIVTAFPLITPAYIASLHSQGIKVSLSLGGAQVPDGAANATVNFHQVLSSTTPTLFTQNFMQSISQLITQYGFDGIDIDIEQGFNDASTFGQPTGDIAVLANIMNQLHAKYPNLLQSMAPQPPNVFVQQKNDFGSIWGSYAALIMQTHADISWVGVQMYQNPSVRGLDGTIYSLLNTQSPDASVAMAADLLNDWNTKTFLPYIAYLNPSQVVLGYLVAKQGGAGDGDPVYPIATIKRALQCLRTATKGADSCDNYAPPKAIANFGGVFEWEANFDKNNGYAFAKGLKTCVSGGSCQ